MNFRFFFFLFLSLFLCACASSESPEISQSSEKVSRESAICRDEILKNKSNVTEVQFRHCETLVSGETYHSMAKWYANTHQVSLNVSKFNNAVMGTETKALIKYVTKDSKHHAGFYYAHEPSFSINILVKNHPDTSRIKDLYKDKSWAHFVNIREVKYTLEEIKAIRQETDKVFQRFKTVHMSWGDEIKNRVVYQIENKDQFLSKLQKEKIKLHEAVSIVSGSPYVCTLVGCSNRTRVNLPITLKPDSYLLRLKFDENEVKNYRVLVTNNLTKECKKNKSSPPIQAYGGSRVHNFLFVDSRVCKDKGRYVAKSVAPFKSFSIEHKPNAMDKTDDPVTIEIEILNGKGKSVLKRTKTIKFDPKSKNQPNGKRCGPICYKGSVNL